MHRINAEKLHANLRKISHKCRHLQMTFYQGNGDLRLLRMLAHHFKETTPSLLAERMDVALPTVSQKLTVLENQGLIGRKPCPGDRRKTIVFATPKGEELIRADYSRFIDSFYKACEKLGEEKVVRLMSLTDELNEYIEQEIHREDEDETY